MRDVAGDPAALELLRVQRSRLADRMRPPWWYLPGTAILWALAFAYPFSSRFLPQGVRIWPILIRRDLIVAAIVVAALAVAAEVALQQAALRGIRQELRGGGGAA